MEVSFSEEIESLRLGAGATFHGEGILAITKGLLQSGVAYVGGYQGAPVSHLLDVMVQAKPYMDELGVHVEACANEASAAAILSSERSSPASPEFSMKASPPVGGPSTSSPNSRARTGPDSAVCMRRLSLAHAPACRMAVEVQFVRSASIGAMRMPRRAGT